MLVIRSLPEGLKTELGVKTALGLAAQYTFFC